MPKRGGVADAGPIVLSLMVQAEMKQDLQERRPFEVLVRHLLDRLLHSETLGAGEEAAGRVIQIGCAVAMPGLLIALYLFPFYHLSGGKPTIWEQASDHLFYVTYAFVVAALSATLEWDFLFPDRLDALILANLPIPGKRLLVARVIALALFFGALLLGTNLLGIISMPAVADLPGRGLRLMGAQAVAVLAAALCAVTGCVAVQGVLIGAAGPRLAQKASPILQGLATGLLFTTIFLEPVLAHFLEPLLLSGSPILLWFPPFWFLGVYERLLWGSAAPGAFVELAWTGVSATVICCTLAAGTYPLAFRRRTRQAIEGEATRGAGAWTTRATGLVYQAWRADPPRRAIYSLIAQTLWRMPRTRLLLAIFGGLGFAIAVASLLLIHSGPNAVGVTLSPEGLRLAVPIVAFWSVAGLRNALHAPVLKAGSWAFRVVSGRAKPPHLYAAEIWVASTACLITLATAGLLHPFSPAGMTGVTPALTQILMAAALPILLTDLFFLREQGTPFLEARPYSVDDLAFTVVTYFLLFPTLCSGVVAAEPLIEASLFHLAVAALILAAIHLALRRNRARLLAGSGRVLDLEDEELLPGEMGLRTLP